MKNILLSADSLISVYSVPDVVADNLSEYCSEFDKWLHDSPNAREYHTADGVCYNEQDFIKYLNTWVFTESPSTLVEVLDGVWDEFALPDKYKQCSRFNF